jgi:hypothetical protein
LRSLPVCSDNFDLPVCLAGSAAQGAFPYPGGHSIQEATGSGPGAKGTASLLCLAWVRAIMTDMPKISEQLETRLRRIEQELAELKATLQVRRTEPWYRQIVGDYAGDEALQQIVRLGRRIRAGKLKS